MPRVDIIFSNKAMTKESKQTEDRDFCFCGCSEKGSFIIFLNFSYEEGLTVSFISF